MSDIKNILIENGVNEELATKITNENKLYSQSDLDNIVNKSKENYSKKVEKDYISRADFEKLQGEYNTLKTEKTISNLKSDYLRNGGIEPYFEDFLKLHGDLLENPQDLRNRLGRSGWAMNSPKAPGETTPEEHQVIDNIYFKDWGKIK